MLKSYRYVIIKKVKLFIFKNENLNDPYGIFYLIKTEIKVKNYIKFNRQE